MHTCHSATQPQQGHDIMYDFMYDFMYMQKLQCMCKCKLVYIHVNMDKLHTPLLVYMLVDMIASHFSSMTPDFLQSYGSLESRWQEWISIHSVSESPQYTDKGYDHKLLCNLQEVGTLS